METLDFTLKLVTPAFLGGADRTWRPDEGLRVPSLRGVLRFWYRAKEGRLDSEELFREESRIFGSTGLGQGLRLIPTGRAEVKLLRGRQWSLNEKYLGYGAASEPWRHPAPEDARFTFRALSTSRQIEELRRVLILLHLFGGVGGRSRRGWGSVAVEVERDTNFLPPWPESGDLAEWIAAALAEVWPQQESRPWRSKGALRYSGFSAATEIHAFEVGRQGVEDALSRFADAFRHSRKEHRKVAHLQEAPPALAFGLPYSAKVEVVSNNERRQRQYEGSYRDSVGNWPKVDRRASPLLFKILAAPGGGLWAVALYLPGTYFGRTQTGLYLARQRKLGPVALPDERAIRHLLAKPLWTTTVTLP